MKILIQVGDVRRVVEVLFPQRGLAGSLQEVSGVGFGGGRLLRKILLIGAQHRILKLLAGLRRDGVDDVPEAAVLVLAAGMATNSRSGPSMTLMSWTARS